MATPNAPARRLGYVGRVVAAILAVATCTLAILDAVVLTVHWRQPAYVMPFSVVVIGCLCVALTLMGGVVAVRHGHPSAWLAPLATVVFLIGFLELFIFVVVPALVIGILVRLLVSNRRRLHKGDERAVATSPWGKRSALLLTLGLVPLFLLALLGQPVVECSSSGESSSTPIWLWPGGFGSGSFSGSTSGGFSNTATPVETSGTATLGNTTYSYVCDGSHLVSFTST